MGENGDGLSKLSFANDSFRFDRVLGGGGFACEPFCFLTLEAGVDVRVIGE